MAKIISHRLFGDIFAGVALVVSALGLLSYPQQSVEAARAGLELCTNVIIPSLFPFFVLSSMMLELGFAAKASSLLSKIMKPLFNLPGCCSVPFVLGFLGGYPVGASTAIALYQRGQCTKEEAERLLSFCNNSGPAFILGVVGAGVFSSSLIGLVLYFAHVLSSVAVGILFRNHKSSSKRNIPAGVGSKASELSFPMAFTVSVKNAFSSTLNICGFVIFFTVVIRLLFLTGIMELAAGFLSLVLSPLGITAAMAEKLLTGVIEMSSGVWSLAEASGSLPGRMSMAAFILGWAGVSVHCQVLSFIGSTGLSTKTYVLGKLLHGLLSAGAIWVIARLIPLEAPVSEYLAEQVCSIASLSFGRAFGLSTVIAALIWIITAAISGYSIAKASGKV